jgi:uncharacterized protein (DUF983 family)
MAPTTGQKWLGMLRQRCPRCCEGKIYAHGMTMNQRCPTCDLLFEREPGYFLGALYISYGLSTIFLLFGLWIGSSLLPELGLGWIAFISGILLLPFVPMFTRYARVIWIYFDRWSWPTRPGQSD